MWSGMVWSSRGIRRTRWHSSFMRLLTFVHGYTIKNDPISGTMNASPPPPPPSPVVSVLIVFVVFCSMPRLLLVACGVVILHLFISHNLLVCSVTKASVWYCTLSTIPHLSCPPGSLVYFAPLIFFFLFFSSFIPFHHLSSLLSSSLHPFSSLPLPPRHPPSFRPNDPFPH